jgi:hypothetical protein
MLNIIVVYFKIRKVLEDLFTQQFSHWLFMFQRIMAPVVLILKLYFILIYCCAFNLSILLKYVHNSMTIQNSWPFFLPPQTFSILALLLNTILLLYAPMLPTRWVKISTYLHSEPFLSITFLLKLKLLTIFFILLMFCGCL